MKAAKRTVRTVVVVADVASLSIGVGTGAINDAGLERTVGPMAEPAPMMLLSRRQRMRRWTTRVNNRNSERRLGVWQASTKSSCLAISPATPSCAMQLMGLRWLDLGWQ